MYEDPIPPPVVMPPAVKSPPAKPATDLSQTDGRTVASLVLLGVGVFTGLLCVFPIIPVAGLIVAVFAKPSTLRIVALVGHVILIVLSLILMTWMFLDFANDPILRRGY